MSHIALEPLIDGKNSPLCSPVTLLQGVLWPQECIQPACRDRCSGNSPPPMHTQELVGKYPDFHPSVPVLQYPSGSLEGLRPIAHSDKLPLNIPSLVSLFLTLTSTSSPTWQAESLRERIYKEKVTFEQRPEFKMRHTKREFKAKYSPLKTALEMGKGLVFPRHKNEACVAATREWMVVGSS